MKAVDDFTRGRATRAARHLRKRRSSQNTNMENKKKVFIT